MAVAYDAAKDEIVWVTGFEEINVSVHHYNGGPAKVQLSRQYRKKDGSLKLGKTGRLTMDEFERLCDRKEKILVHR